MPHKWKSKAMGSLAFSQSFSKQACVLANLDEPDLCCQRGASLGMRLAKVVRFGREQLRYLATSPLLEVHLI